MAEVKETKVDQLIPDDHNFNKGTEFGQHLMEKSFRQFGAGRSILLDKNNRVIAGNKSLQTAAEIGLEDVIVVETTGEQIVAVKRTDIDLDTKQGRELALADNATSKANLDFNLPEIDSITKELDINPADWGIDLGDIDLGIKEAEEDDFDENDDEIPARAALGDIWQLGRHRLMCGDSTDLEQVKKLLGGGEAAMTFCDAPYNIDFHGSMSNTTRDGVMIKHKGANQRHDAIQNDKMDKSSFYEFMIKILCNIKQNVTGAWYLSFSSINLDELLNPLRDAGMNWRSIIIWMKNQATLSMKDYKSRYEPIVYGRFNDAWYGNRGFEEDIWEYQRTLKNDLHPTMKPVPLISKMLHDGSKEGENVLDLFGGSGSTLIACEQLNRNCYMMELDSHYCDVIIARWEKLTGEKAELLNRE